jgi:hypothetical protein
MPPSTFRVTAKRAGRRAAHLSAMAMATGDGGKVIEHSELAANWKMDHL